jgi:hypothetical protein
LSTFGPWIVIDATCSAFAPAAWPPEQRGRGNQEPVHTSPLSGACANVASGQRENCCDSGVCMMYQPTSIIEAKNEIRDLLGEVSEVSAKKVIDHIDAGFPGHRDHCF